MKLNRIIPLAALASIVLLAGSCKKTISPVTAIPDVQIGFFNASEYVLSELSTSGSVNTCRILIDSGNGLHIGADSTVASAPFFGSGTNDNAYLYQFPSQTYYGTQTQPWISYMRIHPGTHVVTLTDTGARTLLTTFMSTTSGMPMTQYYSDSLGHFRSWLLTDAVTPQSDAVSLRVFDLSPDAGQVFFTIGGQQATGFPDTLQYGQITPFTSWHNPAADTLAIRFYNVGDTVDILAGAFLQASPGHAYNIVFTGYLNEQDFPDPLTGNFLDFIPNLRILLTQNK